MTITATIAANKALACRFLDLVTAHDINGLGGLISAGWTMQGGPPNLPSGPAGIRHLFGTFGHIEQVFTATFTHQIVDGLINATWRNADDLGRLFQLGARIEAPSPAPA